MKEIFWKTKTFFKKLENSFLVESTKIENSPFWYKSVISEANVKTNRMVSTKWTYHKEWSFAVKLIYFFENFVSVLKSVIKSWFDVTITEMSIFLLFVSAGVLFDGAFSLLVSLTHYKQSLIRNITDWCKSACFSRKEISPFWKPFAFILRYQPNKC